MSIFEQLSRTSVDSGTSRQSAQVYIEKLKEAVAILTDVNSKHNTGVKAIKLASTDVIAETAPVEIDGNLVSFKMAFNCGNPSPFAVEIITKESE